MFFWFIFVAILCFIGGIIILVDTFFNWRYFYFQDRLIHLWVGVIWMGVGILLLIVSYSRIVQRGL